MELCKEHPAKNTVYDYRVRKIVPRKGRKLQLVWDHMLARSVLKKTKPFTVREIATAAETNVRFVRAYVRVLLKNGYLFLVHTGRSQHDPSTFLVDGFYREKLAPQLAGGSGGGGRLGNGWNAKPAPAAVAVRSKARGTIGRTRRAR